MSNHNQHEYFYKVVHEAVDALRELTLVVINESGINHLHSTIKEKQIMPAFGSLRLDRDKQGIIFLQEYRPTKSLFKKGYFHSIKMEALIRLAEKKKRLAGEKNDKSEYCLILQGNMQKEYFKILLEQGRFSFSTKDNHLQEEPVFAALAVLAQMRRDQIIETHIKNVNELQNQLSAEVEKSGHSLKEIACVVGIDKEGNFYTAPREHRHEFNINVCQYKVIPIEIGKAISMVKRALLQSKNLLILDQLTFDSLYECFTNRSRYYYRAS